MDDASSTARDLAAVPANVSVCYSDPSTKMVPIWPGRTRSEPNFTFDWTAGSHLLAASGQRER